MLCEKVLTPRQVCRLEISLSNDTQRYRDGDESYGNVAGTIKKAERFLDDHPRAKIVVVIDTHASDNGAFVWKGSDDDTFEACFMLEVSQEETDPSNAPSQ